MKVRSNISIDNELKKKAKDQGLEISGLTEWAIRQKLSEKIVSANETLKCEFCGNEGEKETADNVDLSPNSLTWLCPDEKWICNKCLKSQSKYVPIAKK